jgi:hypothetical protein
MVESLLSQIGMILDINILIKKEYYHWMILELL